MSMTSRERWLAILDRREPDRIPTDYWATGELTARLKRDLDCADDEALWRRLHVDRPRFVGPRCKLEHHPDDPQANLWGVRHQAVNYGTGVYHEVSHSPLAHISSVSELRGFRFPSPDDFDYDPITEAVDGDDGTRLMHGGSFEPFLLYCNLRGLEQGFEDLLLSPELAEGILARMFEFFHEHNRRVFEAGRGRIELTYIAEDLGGQAGPLMSLATYRRFLLPNQVRMADLARQHGVHIMYHTDGAARTFIPDLIDKVGIEILNPIQWRCPGMERAALVRDFGGQIAFHGATDNQQTLPFGSADDVRAETADNVRLFAGARWICAPCHNMQAVTPTANVVALYETIHELGCAPAAAG